MDGAATVRATWADVVGVGLTTDGEILGPPLTTQATPRAKQIVQIRARITVN
jgi:hypothetical protein